MVYSKTIYVEQEYNWVFLAELISPEILQICLLRQSQLQFIAQAFFAHYPFLFSRLQGHNCWLRFLSWKLKTEKKPFLLSESALKLQHPEEYIKHL